MITGADSTLGVEASQETFQKCVKEVEEVVSDLQSDATGQACSFERA